jgi:hypothetical protein
MIPEVHLCCGNHLSQDHDSDCYARQNASLLAEMAPPAHSRNGHGAITASRALTLPEPPPKFTFADWRKTAGSRHYNEYSSGVLTGSPSVNLANQTPQQTYNMIVPSWNTTGTGSFTIDADSFTPTTATEHQQGYNLSNVYGHDHSIAMRRLLDYLQDEPDTGEASNEDPNVYPDNPNVAPVFNAIAALVRHSDELRREASGISLVESRVKRIFAAEVLDRIIEELTEHENR